MRPSTVVSQRKNSLKDITPIVVRAMKELRIFNRHTLLEEVRRSCPSNVTITPRRIFDILPLLIGTGMVYAHPWIRKTYVFGGIHGVYTLLKHLEKNPNESCPYLDSKQLRRVGWTCIKIFARNRLPKRLQFEKFCESRRRIYDVEAVLSAAEIFSPSEPWRLHKNFYELERKDLKVSNEEVAELFESHKEVFIF